MELRNSAGMLKRLENKNDQIEKEKSKASTACEELKNDKRILKKAIKEERTKMWASEALTEKNPHLL
jgi:hypothetical protein